MVNPYCIGMTGGIGCGKSTVSRLFAEFGVEIIDTDVIAHALTQPHAPLLDEIAQKLGAELVLPDGTLDRATLRDRIFRDSEAKRTLEAILHPAIRHHVEQAIARSKGPYVIIVVPLLLETQQYGALIHRILVVDCPEPMQIQRTKQRSGLTEETIVAIMAHQVSRATRLSKADDVIDNSGPLDHLRKQVESLHGRYLGLARGIL